MSDGYKTKALFPTDIQLAGYFSQSWEIRPDGDVSIDDYLRPAMYTNVAKNLSVFDVIRILPRNESFFAEVMVSKIAKTGTGVKVPSLVLLRKVDLAVKAVAAVEAVNDDTYEVAWKGPAAKYCVIRKEDKAMIERDLATKDDAYAVVARLKAA